MKDFRVYSYQTEKLRQLSNAYIHPPYFLEKKLLNEIKAGWLSQANATLEMINKLERAKLSDNPLRSLKNSLISSATLFSRAAISANVLPEDAYTLSDFFIHRIESIHHLEKLQAFEYVMVKETVQLIRNNSVNQYSKLITIVIRHIHNNITKKLTVIDLAKKIEKSPDYLSSLFKTEVGLSLKEYINYHKVEIAKHYLEFSTIKVIDLSVLLGYCNQAYFSSVFKRYTSLSPQRYRQTRNPSSSTNQT